LIAMPPHNPPPRPADEFVHARVFLMSHWKVPPPDSVGRTRVGATCTVYHA
jgi:hypothetical protein